MEQKQIGCREMENITEESKKLLEDYHNQAPQQMPTFAEFSKYKLKEGFDFLGKKFEQGVQRASLEKKLLEAKTKQAILAKNIGQKVIEEIALGEPILIPDDMLIEAQQILATKNVLLEEIENVKKSDS